MENLLLLSPIDNLSLSKFTLLSRFFREPSLVSILVRTDLIFLCTWTCAWKSATVSLSFWVTNWAASRARSFWRRRYQPDKIRTLGRLVVSCWRRVPTHLLESNPSSFQFHDFFFDVLSSRIILKWISLKKGIATKLQDIFWIQ